MGEFAFSSGTLSDRRFIHRSQRWKNAYKAIRSPIWRTISNNYLFEIIIDIKSNFFKYF